MVLATQTLLQRRPQDLRGPRRRPPAARRHGQGHHPRPHRPHRRRRRHRPRLRVHRRGHPRALDGGAHDDLQHVHRGWRAGRAHRARRDDLRVRRGPAPCPAGAPTGTPRSRAGADSPRTPGAAYDDVDRHRRRRPRADGHLRHQPGHGHGHHRPRPRPGRAGRARPPARAREGARLHGPPARPVAPRPEGRHRLHRLLHQQPHQRPAPGGRHACAAGTSPTACA